MIRAGWLAVAAAAVIAVILIERRQVIPQPWGYVVYDRLTGNYRACDVTDPNQYLLNLERSGETTIPNSAFDPKATVNDAFKALADGKPDPTERTIPGPFDRQKALRDTAPISTCVSLP